LRPWLQPVLKPDRPASAQNPMFEEWYYISDDPTEPNGQFRHDQRADAVFCDGRVAREAMVRATLDQRLPSQLIGWLAPAILTPQSGPVINAAPP
jgi:prepilin-type processing-associated H-X9-DG protein